MFLKMTGEIKEFEYFHMRHHIEFGTTLLSPEIMPFHLHMQSYT